MVYIFVALALGLVQSCSGQYTTAACGTGQPAAAGAVQTAPAWATVVAKWEMGLPGCQDPLYGCLMSRFG